MPSFSRTTELLPGGAQRWAILAADGAPLSYRHAIAALGADAAFRAWLAGELAGAPMAGFAWETPPITASSVDRPFEMVLSESPQLAHARPDPTDFARELAGRRDVAVFANLGGDATLVVPTERGPRSAYGHLAAFVRGGPREQVDALWRVLASTIESELDDAPLWVSTAGLGVSWLHVRLDTRPKYYRHAPYRAAPR